MTLHRCARIAVAFAVASVTACGGAGDADPPVAVPGVELSRTRVPLGGPMEVRYRFDVPQAAPAIQGRYRVLVHVLDWDGELMWADDHDPPVPTTEWTPGRTIEYTRTIFVPVYPYLGTATVNVGLYSPDTQQRLPLDGDHQGQRAYRVASFDLLPQSEGVFLLYRDGWYPAESSPDDPTVEWQWTRREASVTFRNPRRGATIWLHLREEAGFFEEPRSVTVVVAGEAVETFALDGDGGEMIRRFACSAECFGADDMVELQLRVDRTFVPAAVTGTRDPRELGIRVFHLVIDPDEE